jgi:hypothetical protein
MPNDYRTGRARWGLAFFLLLSSPMLQAQPVTGRVLDDVRGGFEGGSAQLVIRFNFPMRYVTHSPVREGRNLRIQMQFLPIPNLDTAALARRETFGVAVRLDGITVGVVYDGRDSGPSLDIQFSRSVAYQIVQGQDFRSLIITLPDVHAAPPPQARTKAAPGPQPAPEVELEPAPAPERLERLMTTARQALTDKNNSRAIQLLGKLLRYEEHPYRAEAQELLGLARERKGQLAHAKAEYETYLQRYPKGEAADRVRQRLAALLTRDTGTEAAVAGTPGAAKKGKRRTETYGTASVFYYRDEFNVQFSDQTIDPDQAEDPGLDEQIHEVTRSALQADFSLTARQRGEQREFSARVTGGQELDLLDDGQDQTRLAEAWISAGARSGQWSGRVGRQSRSTGGVLGRFDGLFAAVRVMKGMVANFVAGYPVASTRDTFIEDSKPFLGVSMDFEKVLGVLDVNTFFIEQKVDDVTDRRAVGLEARYVDAARSFFGLVDYDLFFDKLVLLLLQANWQVDKKANVTFTADHRTSPFLTTSNALQGQALETIKDLNQAFDEDAIHHLALDRTAETDSITGTFAYQFNDRWQLTGDLTQTEISGTPASGGVEAMPATAKEYFSSINLIGSNLLGKNDINVLTLRYYDTTRHDTVSLRLNSRFQFGRKWRLNPRLEYSARDNKADDGNRRAVRALLRGEYRHSRRSRVEAELGIEWIDDTYADGFSEQTQNYLVSLGYRLDF